MRRRAAWDGRGGEGCNYTGLRCTALQLRSERKLQHQWGAMSEKGSSKQSKQGKASPDLSVCGSAARLGHVAPADRSIRPGSPPCRGDTITHFPREAAALAFCAGVGYRFPPSPGVSTLLPLHRATGEVPDIAAPPARPLPPAFRSLITIRKHLFQLHNAKSPFNLSAHLFSSVQTQAAVW